MSLHSHVFVVIPAVLLAAAGCKSKDKNKPAGDPAGTAAATAGKTTDTAAPGTAAATSAGTGAATATAAAPTRCDLTGKLELRTPSPDATCAHGARFAKVEVELAGGKEHGGMLDLELLLAGTLEEENVMIIAESAVAPANGACAITLKISDAGRADDDESFTFTVNVPAAGGPVKGEVKRSGETPDGKPCTPTSAVEGTFTPGAAAGGPAPAAAPMTAGGLMGPFASLDAYCKAESAKFVKDDCYSMSDQTEMCSCDVATGTDVSGPIAAKGKDGHITDAIIVKLADKAADYTHCSIGLRVGDGWHVAHRAFPCGAAPVSHDGGIDVTITSFKITKSGTTDKVTLASTSDDGQKKTKHAIDCTADAPNNASCAPVRTVK